MPAPTGGARPPYTDLAAHLKALRIAARLTQRDLARAAAVSRGTVQNAETGATAPSPGVLDALLDACRADAEARRQAHRLRTHGRAATRQRDRGRPPAPAPANVRSRSDLADVLAEIYDKAGAPSPAAFTRPGPGLAPIPRTTLYNITARRRLPATEEQLDTYLTICRVRRTDHDHLHAAWQRHHDPHHPPPPTHPRRAPARTTVIHHPRISTTLTGLFDLMTPDELETALTYGAAHVIDTEMRRNGASRGDHRSLHAIEQIARDVLANATRGHTRRPDDEPPITHPHPFTERGPGPVVRWSPENVWLALRAERENAERHLHDRDQPPGADQHPSRESARPRGGTTDTSNK